MLMEWDLDLYYSLTNKSVIRMDHFDRPVARINFGEMRDHQNVDLLNPKSGLFEPYPLNPPTKTPFLAHFVTKSGPFGRFEVVRRTLLATGLHFDMTCVHI